MPQNRNLLIFENPFVLSNFLLKKWFTLATESIEKNNRFTVAFSGGRTPVEFYCKLSGAKDYTQWDQTHVFLTDERFVDPEDDASNRKMLSTSLLNYVHIPQDNIHPIYTQSGDVFTSAECYEEDLIRFFQLQRGEFPCFDLMLLGMGEDGHVASLFPGLPQIEEKENLVVATDVKKNAYKRISLSLPVINHARNIIFIVTGRNKAIMVKQILSDKIEFPARKVMPLKGEILFLLDKEAARELSYFDSYQHFEEAIAVQF